MGSGTNWALAVGLLVSSVTVTARGEPCVTTAEREVIESCGPLDDALARAAGRSRLTPPDVAKLESLHAAACRPMSVDERYERAKLLHVAGADALAAVAFAQIADAPPMKDPGERQTQGFAVTMQLESLNQLLRAGREACIGTMKRVAARAERELCHDGEPEELCGLARRVQIDATRHELESGADDDDAKDMKRRAEGMLRLFDRFGAEPCAGMKPECRGFDEVLYNAARFFDGAGERWTGARVRRLLVDPTYHLNDTMVAAHARVDLFHFYTSIARYEAAISEGLALATRHPKLDAAPELLLGTLQLQLGLGDLDGATASLQTFRRLYERKRRHDAIVATMLVAEALLDEGRVEAARRVASVSSMRKAGHHGMRGVVIELHRLEARLAEAAGDEGRRAKAYEHIVLLATGLMQGEAPEEIGPAVDAIGEALAFEADRRREAVLAHVASAPRRGRREAWSMEADVKLADAERAYGRIEALEPDAPARWLVHAQERVGSMHALVAERGLDAGEHGAMAERAYARCLRLALERQQLDETARRCVAFLRARAPRGTSPSLGPSFRGPGSALVRPAAPMADPRAE